MSSSDSSKPDKVLKSECKSTMYSSGSICLLQHSNTTCAILKIKKLNCGINYRPNFSLKGKLLYFQQQFTELKEDNQSFFY